MAQFKMGFDLNTAGNQPFWVPQSSSLDWQPPSDPTLPLEDQEKLKDILRNHARRGFGQAPFAMMPWPQHASNHSSDPNPQPLLSQHSDEAEREPSSRPGWMFEPSIIEQLTGPELPKGAVLHGSGYPVYPDTGEFIHVVPRPLFSFRADTPDGPTFVMPKIMLLAEDLNPWGKSAKMAVKAPLEMVLKALRQHPGPPPARKSVDGTLGKKVADVRFRGKDVSEFTPRDWHDFGLKHGVANLGPADEIAWTKSLQTVFDADKRAITIPGGSGPFTYYDLLHLKAQGINPAKLDLEVNRMIHERLIAALQPKKLSQEAVANRLIFGLLSGNRSVTPSELALQRIMIKGEKDLKELAESAPHHSVESVAVNQRKMASAAIAHSVGLQSVSRGGIGVSANMFDAAQLAQKLRENPKFFRFNMDDPALHGLTDQEKTIAYMERIWNEVRGLGPKTSALAAGLQSPITSSAAAIDRHVATRFYSKLFASAADQAAFEEKTLKRFNEGRKAKVETFQQMLAEPGGRSAFVKAMAHELGKASELTTKSPLTGAYNPGIPGYLRNLERPGAEPETLQLLGDAYRRGMNEIASKAESAGRSPFSQQWMEFALQRERFDPHLMLFPEIEKLPRMSLKQMLNVRKELSEAGYLANSGSVRPMKNPSKGAFFSVSPTSVNGYDDEEFQKKVFEGNAL